MKAFNTLLTFLFLITVKSAFAQGQAVTINSPDKRLSLSVFTTDKKLVYSVRAGNTPIIKPSALGLKVDNTDLGDNAQISGTAVLSTINESYAILGNHSVAYNRANEADIPVAASGRKFSIIVRVYNDGVAIRYTIPVESKHIDGEYTAWSLPDKVTKIAWADFHQSYEGLNYVTPVAKIPEGKTIMSPVTFEAGGYYVSIAEADCENFSDMALVRNGNVLSVNFPFAKSGWDIKPAITQIPLNGMYHGKQVSPWRTTLVARSMNELVNSDLVTNLCPAPAAGSDFSWVKPGRALWQWWSVGSPKYEDQKKWYDAAAKLKWEYYLVDDGWRYWQQPGKDQWALLKEVINYGKTVGVKSLVWVDSKEFRKAPERKAYLEKVKAIGADGIKIDFIPDATDEIMQWYAETMQDCADLKLLLNFHGSVKPTGLRRTYPNDMTREAIRGNEYHMTRYNRVMPPQHDVTVPFTRLLAGPADFTAVILNPKELESTKFTWPHEFAQAIVYLSPITHFADQYQYYLDSPMFDLFQQLPTTWDETRVLPCTSMGDVVAFARRKGDTWWVGVMNGGDEREIKIPLDFLNKKTQASLVYDGATNNSVDRREQTVTKHDVLTIRLRPSGGFVAKM
ncbi:glycoside hydrolase family 97 protein [Mucilaginibacter paludis]|uniref:Glycoside hydrolase 97 n=1 Tax=Mucilaginibacter paludis DSM 18603 TaxID=714943 RepID=H1Y8B6_9SPHI|nr:glycoside hydrolase family 97 protein [Mucilaginibacter paludis]EHQ24935.1 Glycoside hydrolase 97 [Mucilaginibacter paludis DSM 18603]